MSWEYVALALIVSVGILLFVCRKNALVKRYWRYSLILLPLALLLVLKIVTDLQRRKVDTGGTPPDAADALSTKIGALKDDLVEAQMISAIEVSAAREKNNDTLKELEQVLSIPDKTEKRRRLAAMIG